MKKDFVYLDNRHKNMNIMYEVEENNELSFLDAAVSREENNSSTSLYRKPTFSGLYTNFASFIADGCKKGLIYYLLF